MLTLELKVTVTYEPNGTRAAWLKDNLENVIRRAMGDGWFTEDSPAEVESYNTTITEV